MQFSDSFNPGRNSTNPVRDSEPGLLLGLSSPMTQLNHLPSESAASVSTNPNVRMRWDTQPPAEARRTGIVESMKNGRVEGGHVVNPTNESDQNAIYSALMTYMVDALKGGS